MTPKKQTARVPTYIDALFISAILSEKHNCKHVVSN